MADEEPIEVRLQRVWRATLPHGVCGADPLEPVGALVARARRLRAVYEPPFFRSNGMVEPATDG